MFIDSYEINKIGAKYNHKKNKHQAVEYNNENIDKYWYK